MAGQHSDFWPRRRAAVEAEAAAGAEAARRAALKRDGQAAALAQADKSDAEILDELGLQDPDAMVAGDDFAAFLQGAARTGCRIPRRPAPITPAPGSEAAIPLPARCRTSKGERHAEKKNRRTDPQRSAHVIAVRRVGHHG